MSELPPQIAPPVERRFIWSWVILFGLFALLWVSALAGSFASAPKHKASKVVSTSYEVSSPEDMTLRQVVTTNALLQALKKNLPKDAQQPALTSVNDQVDPMISVLVDKVKTDKRAARYYAALRTEVNQAIPDGYLGVLEKSSDPADRAFARIYGAKTLTLAEAKKLADALPDKPYVYNVAKARAYLKAGDSTAFNKISDPKQTMLLGLVAFAVCAGFTVSVILLIVFSSLRNMGKLVAKGHPFLPMSLARADALALRALTLIVGFILISDLLGAAIRGVGAGQSMIVRTVLMIVFTIVLFRTPVLGQTFSLRELGFTTKDLGKNILWGIGAWFANWVFLAIAVLPTLLFSKYLPSAYHPVEDLLKGNQPPMVLFGVWMLAAVSAPFWEEIMFRGCLFPALSRLTKKEIYGAILSSLMFAGVHPQGILGWLPIATIGMMNCFLVRQTRSIIPSMTLHLVNNTFALVAAYYVMNRLHLS